ncbi:heme transporter hrg1-A-like [Mercenaria mercenaria]|uniref:heme transporter hrg1-A-like n=1 Tax=Mercenaria mercenaria TaxID=6596 RepID=UPI00234E81DE|nr:heme transporter hrg1-A-like [Mercenaria mercenaria]
MAAPGERKYLLCLFFSVLGITIGVSVFFVFGFHYKNWNASLWGLSSALPALVTLLVHVRNKRRRFETCPERLRVYMLGGCFVQLAGVCGFVTYLTLAITLKQGLLIYGNGYYLTCVWCFMVWKWGFLLFYFSRVYWREHQCMYTILPRETTQEVKVNTYGT